MEMELDCHLNRHYKLSGCFFLFILVSHFRSLVSQSRKIIIIIIFGGEISILCIYSIGIGIFWGRANMWEIEFGYYITLLHELK